MVNLIDAKLSLTLTQANKDPKHQIKTNKKKAGFPQTTNQTILSPIVKTT